MRLHQHVQRALGGPALLILAVQLAAGESARAQTRAEDLKSVWTETLSRLSDLQFSGVQQSGGPDESLSVWLVTQGDWPVWKYRRHYSAGPAGMRDVVIAYDGDYVRQLQTDGMGLLSSQPRPNSYMTVVGMFLSNWGPAPRDAKGRRLSWLEYLFNSTDLTVQDQSDRPGTVVIQCSMVRVELDATKGFSPTAVTWYADDGKVLSETRLSDYRQIGGLWAPHRFEDLRSPYRLTVSDVKVNQGLTKADMRVEFPLGTSLLLDNNVVRVAGDSPGVEEEAGLQSWLIYEGDFGRKQPRTTPRAEVETVREPDGTSLAFIVANVVLALILGGAAFVRGRRAPRVAVAIAAAALSLGGVPRSEAQLVPTDLPERSTAHSVYVVLSAYERGLPLDDVLAEVDAPHGPSLSAASAALRRHGLHTCRVDWPVDKLAAWPYPVVLLLRRLDDESDRRCGVLLASDPDRFTMFDSGQYGQLAPWSREFLEQRVTGEALLTSPVPIEIRDPLKVWLYLSFALPALGIAAFFLPRARLGRAARHAALPLLVLLVGCGRSGLPQEAAERASVRLDTNVWEIGEVYPGSVRRRFTLTNESSRAVSLVKVEKSCGCIATGLPEKLELKSRQVYEFDLRISLENPRGPVHQWIRMHFSEGLAQTINLEAFVKRGLLVQPDRISLKSAVPNELLRAEVKVICDDGQPFQIKSASCARAMCELAGSAGVSLSLVNDNRQASLQDVLVILTNHPSTPELRVPILANFDLTWEVRPAVVAVKLSEAGPSVARTIRILSKQRTPFTVAAARSEAWSIAPESSIPAETQEVRLSVSAPAASAALPKRVAVPIATTLADASEIQIPVIFY